MLLDSVLIVRIEPISHMRVMINSVLRIQSVASCPLAKRISASQQDPPLLDLPLLHKTTLI